MSIGNIGELPLWKDEAAQEILNALSIKHGVPMCVLKALVATEQQSVGKERRRGIFADFDMALDGFEENV